MYSYRLRLGPAVQPAESPTGLARLKSRLLDRLQLHTEVTFWEFDQVRRQPASDTPYLQS